MTRKQNGFTFRYFIGERQLTLEEARTEIGPKMTERMGQVFNTYFGEHPDVYVKVCRAADEKEQAVAAC